METFKVMGVDAHPFELNPVTVILPFGPFPQFTFTMFVPCPEEIVPPVTDHVKELPLEAATLYVPDTFEQSGLGPLITVGPL